MHYRCYSDLLRDLWPRWRRTRHAPGPIALVLADDVVGRDATLRHCLGAGFATVVCVGTTDALPTDLEGRIALAPGDPVRPGALQDALNPLLDRARGAWVHVARAGEFLSWPFGTTRDVAALCTFAASERRAAIAGTTVDLYPGRIGADDWGAPGSASFLDRQPYTATRPEGADDGRRPRELALYGGLRLRHADVLQDATGQRLDRPALVRAVRGLRMDPDGRFSAAEMHTRHGPWHNSVTATILSTRAARALDTRLPANDRRRRAQWAGSVRFTWAPDQLVDLGFMDPGQWV